MESAPTGGVSGADVSRETPSAAPSPSPVSRETPRRPIALAVINQKGGVGKTTTAVNLAADLASRGFRTLLFDLDPQGNASTALGIDRYQDGLPTSHDFLFAKGSPPAPVSLGDRRPDLYPGNIQLIRAEVELMSHGDHRDRQLRRNVETITTPYDFLVFDAPPSLGILTLNILIASERLIIPVQCEYLALEGLTMLLETISEIRQSHNTALGILGCLITMTDLRTNLSQQVVADIRGHFGDTVFDTMIPRTVRLSECPSHGQTIFQYDRWGAGARSYEALTNEVLHRLGLPARIARTPEAAK